MNDMGSMTNGMGGLGWGMAVLVMVLLALAIAAPAKYLVSGRKYKLRG
jgi:hypothetical protein